MARRVLRRGGADGAGGRLRRCSRREGRRAPRRRRRPRPTVAAKPDISKVGDVTLTVWDQNVRGGQNKEIEELNKQFMAKYPNVKIERTAKSFEDLLKTVKLAVSGPNAPDVVQANQGRGDHGRDGQGRAAAPGHRLRRRSTAGTTATRRRCWTLNSFSSDGKEFGSGDLYGLSQAGEIVGVFYNKDEGADAADDARPSSRPRCRRPRTRARRRSCSATSRSGRASTTSSRVLGQTADKQAIRDFVFAKDGASFDNPEFTGRRHEDQGVGRQGLLQQGLQRHRLRPGVAGVREGQEPVPDRRHVGHGRPGGADGRQGRLHADAGQGPERAGVARRRGPAVVDHLGGQEPRRRGGLHRLPHRRQRGQGARRHGQPAGDEGRAGADRRRCRPTSRRRGRSSTRPTA